MKSASDATPEPLSESPEPVRRPAAVWVIATILTVQTLGWTAVAIWVASEMITGASSSLATALFELVLVVLAAVWMGATVLGTLGTKAWARASLVAIEVLHGAAAVAAFQGYLVHLWLGWVLLVPAVVALVLAFTPRMTALYARQFHEG